MPVIMRCGGCRKEIDMEHQASHTVGWMEVNSIGPDTRYMGQPAQLPEVVCSWNCLCVFAERIREEEFSRAEARARQTKGQNP